MARTGRRQVTLDMRALGADWYAGNCHKWLCAPKGSAFLYAAPDRQADLHPVTISHGLGKGFLEEFDWTGTRDPSAWLATDVAIDFHARLGGEALMARNIALAAEATALLARRLNTDAGATGAMAGSMGVVRLPLAGDGNGGTFGRYARAAAGGRDRCADACAGRRDLAADFGRRLQRHRGLRASWRKSSRAWCARSAEPMSPPVDPVQFRSKPSRPRRRW